MGGTIRRLRLVRLRAWWRSRSRGGKRWFVVFAVSLVVLGSTVVFQGARWIHAGLPWPDAYHASLGLDALGHPHVAWGTDRLEYGSFSGVAWSSEDVDADVAVDSVSLGLDSHGGVHIAYGAWNRSGDHVTSYLNVKYATNVGGSWVVSYIAYDAFAPSIAVDSQGHVHLAYVQLSVDHFSRTTCYRVLSGGLWSPPLMLPDGGWETGRITLDSRGYPYIPIHDVVPGYATNRGGSWHVVRLDSEIEAQSIPSLVVDGGDYLHLSYTAWSAADQSRVLRYATNSSGSWTFSTLDRLENTNSDLAVIAQGSSGPLQIMYSDFRAGPENSVPTLRHAVQMHDGWTLSVVSSNAFIEGPSSFAVSAGGKANVIYVQDARSVGQASSESRIIYATEGLDAFILPTFLMENVLVLAGEILVLGLALMKALRGRTKRPWVLSKAKADP